MTRCREVSENGKERKPRKLVHGMDTMNSDAGNRRQKQTEVHRFNIPLLRAALQAVFCR